MVTNAPVESTTAWESSRFDGCTGARKLLFGCMHEDVAVELVSFPPGGHIFCIASAGCTAMHLSAQHEVVAVDINPLQVAYVESRLAGAPVRHGSAEQLLRLIRRFAPLVGWGRERTQTFLDLELPNEQLDYWHRHLDTKRFRLALDLFFARTTLRAIYSSALVDCLPSGFGAVMRARMERGFRLHPNRRNPYARMLLLGEFPPTPEAVAPERISLACSDAASFLEQQPPCSFTGFSLSNILDGANRTYEQRLLAAVRRTAAPGAIVVRRSFREPSTMDATNRAADDRSMLWGIVDVREAAAL